MLAKFLNVKQDWLIDMIFLAFFLLIFYFFWLGHYPFFTPDEGRYAEIAREMVASGDYITPRLDGIAFLDKPVFYYWLQSIAIHLFGVTEWSLRFFPALFGMMGCLITYFCGRSLFNRRTGLLSAIILATTPLYFGAAHYANLDLMVAVLISCCLLFFITAIQYQGKWRLLLLLSTYGFAGLAFLTKGLIGLAFPCLIIGSWIILTKQFILLRKIYLLPGFILFLLIVSPWYLLVEKANPGFLHYFFIIQQMTRFFSVGNFNNQTPIWFYIPIIFIGLFPWVIFLIQAVYFNVRVIRLSNDTSDHSVLAKTRERQNLFSCQQEKILFLLIWASVIFVFFSIPHSKTVTYILPIFPALALLIGDYLSANWEVLTTKNIQWGVSNFLVMGMMLIIALSMLAYCHLINFQAHFWVFLGVMILILFVSLLISFILRHYSMRSLFNICAVCSVLLLLTLTLGTQYLNLNSAKPLAITLKKLVKPGDEVIFYFKYYQDVPLYLEQRVAIVADWQSTEIPYKDNWVRELWYGMPFQKANWLMDETTFWQHWESNKRIFVFVKANYFDQFKKQAKNYFILGEYNHIFLLSNQPTILASVFRSVDQRFALSFTG